MFQENMTELKIMFNKQNYKATEYKLDIINKLSLFNN